MEVRLISVTPDAEKQILYIARVSNPANQNSQNTKLIDYLIRKKHFSPFEHAFMTVEVKTSRAIATQMLRHRSFTWQEFSQRYSEVQTFEPVELRKQAEKNRQSSTDVFDPMLDVGDIHIPASEIVDDTIKFAESNYKTLIKLGVAKEVARMILPLTTQTTLYMSGSLRSFIHYVALRTQDDVQKEHRDIARAIKGIMYQEFPIIMEAIDTQDKKLSEDRLLLDLLLSRGDLLQQLVQDSSYGSKI